MAFDLFKMLGWRRGQPGLVGVGGGVSTKSSVTVNLDVALQTSAFLRAARVVAEGLGTMPLKLFEETENEKGQNVRTTAYKNKSYRAVCYTPNAWMSKSELVETLTLHAFVLGDGYALLNRGGEKKGPILEILPIPAGCCTLTIGDDWEPKYTVTMGSDRAEYGPDEVFHLRGPSWDGKVGLSVLEKAREAIGLARALEQSHGSLMGADARPAGVLSTSGSVNETVADKIRAAWKKAYGAGGDRGVAVLDNGFTFSAIGVTAVDAQFIENRRFQIEEIARATGVFPQMLMHVDKTATFASSSEFFAAHVKYTMLPWVNRWEESLKRAIGWDGKNADIWPRMTMDVLLRANATERGGFYNIMLTNGVMNANEVRALENLNPRKGGDEYYSPMNMRVGQEDPAKDPKDPPKDPNDPNDPPPPPKDPAK